MTHEPARRSIRRLAGVAAPLALGACGGSQGDRPGTPVPAGSARADFWFTDVTGQAGLTFRHSAGRRDDYYVQGIMGSGGALFDYDYDGDLDIYLIDADGEGPAPNRMFRQEAGGRFTDVSETSGLGDPGYGMGAALGDVDNDGDLDLFVSNVGRDALYLNGGGGVFEDVTEAAGVGHPGWSTSACFLDYDLDGLLDLYVATYLHLDLPKACTDRAGNLEFCGPEAYRGLPDLLYRGRGDGTFTDVGSQPLAGRPANKGLGVLCADFNGDVRTDVYVANDGEQSLLWIRGEGADGARFEDRALILGAALNFLGRPEASMGVAAGDADADGDLDLFLTHLDRETNTLYRNLGDTGFEDYTAASGLGPAGMAHTGFGTAFFDADADGNLDLVVVNGRVRRGASLIDRAQRRRKWQVEDSVPPLLWDYAEPNLFFLGDGDGGFSNASGEGGRLTSSVEVSRGIAAGDLDRDGDLDLLVTNCGGPVRLYRNDAPGKGHWLVVRAIDPELKRDALGATVEVRAGGRRQVRPVISSTSYLMAVEPQVHFGLGSAERVEGITVVWPDGTREAFAGGAPDRTVELVKGRGESP